MELQKLETGWRVLGYRILSAYFQSKQEKRSQVAGS